MNQLKIDNFIQLHPGKNFPKFTSLDINSVKKVRDAIAHKVNLEGSMTDLFFAQSIDTFSKICVGINAEDIGFSIKQTLLGLGINHLTYVYINWYRYDAIDELSIDGLDEFFDDIWYPAIDDIDIIDINLSWILSITHFGQVKFLRL
ncbi:MAG TPA: hypothetical protein VN030_11670 [Cellvibrio sp.]|nr:hypothetical protein [Cellvibrio sp.]